MKRILENMTKVQHAWVYLDPIFNSSDLRDQMKNEETSFRNLNTIWCNIINSLVENPNAFRFFSQENLLESLEYSVYLYEIIYKGLGEYLEKKRLFFPRFFFLSNDELLEILSETRDALRVEPHLKKCFEGIRKLSFTSDKNIKAIISAESEEVKLIKQVIPDDANGLVEVWLQEVETLMRSSLKFETSKAIDDYKLTSKSDWIVKYPGQVVISTSIIFWTHEITKRIPLQNGIKSYLKDCDTRLEEILLIVRNNLSKFTSNLRITIEALIVIEVHGKILS